MSAELPTPTPTLRLRLDGAALTHNWSALDRLSGDAAAGAAVKADAYGLGVREVAPVLQAAGARTFFLAHWSEVAALAASVQGAQMAVLHGPLTHADCAYARESGAVPVINSLYQAKLWHESGGGPCHVMVDTGINRLGLAMDEIGDPAIAQLNVDILLSHLASADEDSSDNQAQLARFCDAAVAIPSNRRSLANSAGIALGADYAFDLTRPGLALYGGVPRRELADTIRQVAFPQTAIIQTRSLNAGDKVGYNGTFVAREKMRVGVVSIGYADGYLRTWSDKGRLAHEDHALPVLGRVSMDMIVVDLSSTPMLREGDWLDLPYALPQAAEVSGLSQYELLTLLGQRLRRSIKP